MFFLRFRVSISFWTPPFSSAGLEQLLWTSCYCCRWVYTLVESLSHSGAPCVCVYFSRPGNENGAVYLLRDYDIYPYLCPICVKSHGHRRESASVHLDGRWSLREGEKPQRIVSLDQSQVQRLPLCVRSYYPPHPLLTHSHTHRHTLADCLSVCLCPRFSRWTDWWEPTFASIPRAVSTEPVLSLPVLSLNASALPPPTHPQT